MNGSLDERLRREAELIGQLYGQPVQYGQDTGLGCSFIYLAAFRLPPGWQQHTTPILVTVPDRYPGYPMLPPTGFYLANHLRTTRGRKPDHYFEEQRALNMLSDRGYAYFCLHARRWQPGTDIMQGDSLVKYLNLVHLGLSQVVSRP